MRYSREDGCRAWLTYANPKADALCDLLTEFGNAEAVYDRFMSSGGAFLKKWINQYGIDQLKEHSSRQQMHDMLVTMQKHDIGIISWKDDAYPASLHMIQNPPALLFYKGDLECTMGKCVAVDGD